MQHLLEAFLPKQNLMVVWLNRVMYVLCQGQQQCCHRNNTFAEKHGSP